jgi:hypothetical protein
MNVFKKRENFCKLNLFCIIREISCVEVEVVSK